MTVLTPPKIIRSEQDSAWKEILDAYFNDCVDYCLPDLSKLIDWQKPYLSLDKELLAITKSTEGSKRLLDKLFKVYLKDGREQWVLVHIEIQGKPEDDFPNRMFTYGYRIYDKYRQPVVSCAILTDDNKKWRPNYYKIGLAGSYLSAEFLVIKLIDYHAKKLELEISNNPFASVILVQLMALETKRRTNEERKQVKFTLTKRLYEKGFSKEAISNLYKFIDWLIGLSEPLELEYLQDIYQLEEAKKMPYISNAERFGIKIGIQRGMEQGLEQGLEQGREQGLKQGLRQGIHLVASTLLEQGADIEFVAKVTKLDLNEVKRLQQELTS